MKNLRKIVDCVVEYVAKNPAPKGLGFTDEEMKAAANEVVDLLSTIVELGDSLRRIAEGVEAHNLQMMNIEMNTRPKR